MKQLVFYVSSPGSDSWVVAGTVLTYSAGGPARLCTHVSQAKQFQPSCRGRNWIKPGVETQMLWTIETPPILRTFFCRVCILQLRLIALKSAACAAFLCGPETPSSC